MSVGECFKTDNLSDLDIAPSALYLLASPSTPEDIRQSILEEARAGGKITLAAVRKAIGPGDEPKTLPPVVEPEWLQRIPSTLRRNYEYMREEILRACCLEGYGIEHLGPVIDTYLGSDDAVEVREHIAIAQKSICCICRLNYLEEWSPGCYGNNPDPYPTLRHGRCCASCDEDVKQFRMAVMLASTDDEFYKQLPSLFEKEEKRQGEEEGHMVKTIAIDVYDVATKTRNREPGGWYPWRIPQDAIGKNGEMDVRKPSCMHPDLRMPCDACYLKAA